MSVYRVWDNGEIIPYPTTHFVRGDLRIVQSGDLFYVGVETRKKMHGGYFPSVLVESWPLSSFGEALQRLEAMEATKADHCERFNCE